MIRITIMRANFLMGWY